MHSQTIRRSLLAICHGHVYEGYEDSPVRYRHLDVRPLLFPLEAPSYKAATQPGAVSVDIPPLLYREEDRGSDGSRQGRIYSFATGGLAKQNDGVLEHFCLPKRCMTDQWPDQYDHPVPLDGNGGNLDKDIAIE